MSRQLYDEAIADVKKIKEIALNDAKHAVLEAVTPRIRKLIESTILSEDCDDKELEEKDCEVIEDDSVKEEANEPSVDVDKEIEEITETFQNFNKASRALRATSGFTQQISKLIERVEAIYDYAQGLNETKQRNSYEQKLEELYRVLKSIQETSMKAKKNRINEEDVTVRLTGMPDGIDLDSIGVDLIGAEGDELAGDGSELPPEADPAAVDDLDVGMDDTVGDEDEILDLEGLQMESFDDVFGMGPGDEDEDGPGDNPDDLGDHVNDDDQEPVNKDTTPIADRDAPSGISPEEYDEHVDEFTDENPDWNLDSTPISHDPPYVDKVDQHGEPVGGVTTGSRGLGEALKNLSDDTIVEIDENMLKREIKRMREARLGAPENNKELNRQKYAGPDKKSYQSFGGSKHDDGDPLTDIEYEQPESLKDGTGHELKHTKYTGGQMKGQKDFGGSRESEGDPLELDIEDDDRWMQEAKIVVIPDDWEVAPDADDIHDKKVKELEKEKIRESLEDELTLEARLLKRARARCEALKTEHFKAKKSGDQRRLEKLKLEYKKSAMSVNESIETIKKLKARLEAPKATKGIRENRVPQVSTDKAVQELRAQLAETNLHNVKLTYANKLLQNGNFSAKQKRAVIVKLDEAKNVREAKLVYDSLTNAIANRSVNEGADRKVIGSSSRSTRPSSTITPTPGPTLNESAGWDIDRLAQLAGIKK